ncbi:hypothetical protein D3C83_156380 [compost metagenome]
MSVPAPPLIWSPPLALLASSKMSSPLPPSMTSLPSPPAKLSLPSPPMRTLSYLLPVR